MIMELEKLMQTRIANIAVGGSTVRGQPKNTANSIREFLKGINLSKFESINNDKEFENILNILTDELINRMPNGNFGFARKCLNIFLFEICHNVPLSKKYDLQKLIPYLEIPLDNPNEKKLSKHTKELKDWDWTSIKNLKSEDNVKIQGFARKYMRTNHDADRVYFELMNWRSTD
jgi:hypothetical protein